MTKEKKQLILRYTPHEAQKQIHSDNHRFKIICAGRRFGKSIAVMADMVNRIMNKSYKYNQHSQLGWISPTHAMSQRGLDALKLITRDCHEIVTIVNSHPATATFFNGVKIKFLSSDRPDALRGYGWDHIVIDEADFVEDYVWQDVIRPALSDKMGTMIAISTPKRKHSWFHKLYLLGLQDDPQIQSFHFPSSANPYLPKEEIEINKKLLPEQTFLREWLAEWVDDGGEVFQGIEKCFEDKPCECKAPTFLGIDLAKHQDYTVIISLCSKCNKIKSIDRFNTLDWNTQKNLIKSVYINSVLPRIFIDASGVGDVIYDDLVKDGLNVTPFKFTNSSKQQLINNLRLIIMQQGVKWNPKMDNANLLKHELECYEIQATKTGQITYNAPIGMHDDLVIGLALACKGMESYISPHVSQEQEKEVLSTISQVGWIEDVNEGYDFGDNSTFFGGM